MTWYEWRAERINRIFERYGRERGNVRPETVAHGEGRLAQEDAAEARECDESARPNKKAAKRWTPARPAR